MTVYKRETHVPQSIPALVLEPGPLLEIFRALQRCGGRALVVGGWVRDRLLGLPAKDVDVEVYGLQLDQIRKVLGQYGTVMAVGRAFAVLKVKGVNADFSLPRASSLGARARGDIDTGSDPTLTPEAAARRRDLTINSMAYDPLCAALIDPLHGLADLRAGCLRAADPGLFAEDPVRGLRVAELLARFGARFNMRPDARLRQLCGGLDLAGTAPERLFESFKKLLLRGETPSLGLEFLQSTALVAFFPELAALQGVPQSPFWHPEGCVWTHTLMVVDAAVPLRQGDEDDLALMFGALCHDFGKPQTTQEYQGRIRAPRHERVGVPHTERFLQRLTAPKQLTRKVSALVGHHLKPVQFPAAQVGAPAYRRLARNLETAGVSLELLARVARADQLGRTTDNARRGLAPEIDSFLARAMALEVSRSGRPDVVQGRHLLARGIEPGPQMGELLDRCRTLQDEMGETTPDQIVDRLFDTIGSADGQKTPPSTDS